MTTTHIVVTAGLRTIVAGFWGYMSEAIAQRRHIVATTYCGAIYYCWGYMETIEVGNRSIAGSAPVALGPDGPVSPRNRWAYRYSLMKGVGLFGEGSGASALVPYSHFRV